MVERILEAIDDAPRVFSRVNDLVTPRAYEIGYISADGEPVVVHSVASHALAESCQYDLEREVVARAAIAAIRLPTLGMVLAGARKAAELGHRELADEYTAMIDSILEEKKEG